MKIKKRHLTASAAIFAAADLIVFVGVLPGREADIKDVKGKVEVVRNECANLRERTLEKENRLRTLFGVGNLDAATRAYFASLGPRYAHVVREFTYGIGSQQQPGVRPGFAVPFGASTGPGALATSAVADESAAAPSGPPGDAIVTPLP